MKKRNTFLRTIFISGVAFACIILLIIGIFESYENIREISFAEFTPSIEIKEDYIRILDFIIKK